MLCHRASQCRTEKLTITMKNRGKKSGKMSVTYDSVNVTLVILLWRDGEKLHPGHVSFSEVVKTSRE